LSQRAVDAVFQASFLLCELRMILRKTAPFHHLEEEQVNQTRELLHSLEIEVQTLQKELIS
jgi:hypothetical protein